MATSKNGFRASKPKAIDTSGDPKKLADSVVDLAKFVEDELAAVATSMQSITQLQISYVAPDKPRQGMVVYADGTHWNPGSREGAYAYGSDATWHFLENIAPPSLPLSVANGGTGDTGSVWTAYTPSSALSTPGTSVMATALGRWKSIGKTIFFAIDATITTVGTGTGMWVLGLPVAATTFQIIPASGRELVTLGAALAISSASASTVHCAKYDNTSLAAGGNGTRVMIGGVYEAA